MKKGVLLSIVLVFIATLAFWGMTPALAQYKGGPVRLTFTAGPIGGAWYPLGGAVAEIIKAKIPGSTVTVTTGGGVGNVPRVHKKLADLGLSQAMLYASGLKGIEPYKEPYKNVRALGYVGFIPQAFFLVPEGSRLNSVAQIKAEKYPLRLVTTPRASTPELAARRLLAQYGITYKDIQSWGGKIFFVGFAEAQTLISDGHAEAYIGPVVGAINQMITLRKMKLLPWDEPKIDKILKKYGYLKRRLKKGRYYFIKKDLPVLAEANIFIIRADLPDDLVYSIAEAIATSAPRIRQSARLFRRFDPKKLWKDVGGPLHPGAEKYYRAAGLMP